jgi:hypothetical protein
VCTIILNKSKSKILILIIKKQKNHFLWMEQKQEMDNGLKQKATLQWILDIFQNSTIPGFKLVNFSDRTNQNVRLMI